MDEKPYETPKVVSSVPEELAESVRSSRNAVAHLVGVVFLQWLCHLLIAIAMFHWMDNVTWGAATAKALDTACYGLACVGFTGVLTFAAGLGGITALKLSK
jgi:hypothetical protein